MTATNTARATRHLPMALSLTHFAIVGVAFCRWIVVMDGTGQVWRDEFLSRVMSTAKVLDFPAGPTAVSILTGLGLSTEPVVVEVLESASLSSAEFYAVAYWLPLLLLGMAQWWLVGSLLRASSSMKAKVPTFEAQ